MKGFLKILSVFFYKFYIIGNLVKIFTIPVLFLIVGFLNDFSWQYYTIMIGGYFIVAIVIQVICHFIFYRFEKWHKSTPVKKFEKISGEKDNQQE